MTTDNSNGNKPADTGTERANAVQGAPAPKKTKHKGLIITAVIVAVLVVAFAGFWTWHETPGFCAAICHNMDEYLDTYQQPQNQAGVDKYGNAVSNTNAMMATLHRSNDTTAKSEIRCMACHHAVVGEQVSEAMGFVSGNYYYPLYERVGDDLTYWWGEDVSGDQFCVNENCHVYLQDATGGVNRDKLEASTMSMEFNPHSQHHEGIEMDCTTCHKGHRASVVECTGCHEHENATLPDGWITKAESDTLMAKTF